jgi:16S rRNA (guanine527-N7)-methyltransferase
MPDSDIIRQIEQSVSRETLNALHIYDACLHKWQKTINLVSPTTLKESWERHFCDSLQILPFIDEKVSTLVDMGSGAGFPGLVIAIARPDITIHLVESDTRKGSFLRTVKTELQLDNVAIHTKRIECISASPPLKSADIVTARALSGLTTLVDWALPFMNPQNPQAQCIFPKGRSFKDEIVSLQSDKSLNEQRLAVSSKSSLIEPEAALVFVQKT